MQAAQRVEYNHALEYSIQKANELKQPLVVVFAVTDKYPDANLRHYHFMLTGLQEVKVGLEKRGIIFVIKHLSPELAVPEIAQKASWIVTDAGYTHIQRNWRNWIASNINCPLEEVETNLIVPVTEASDKENFSAGVFRPRIKAKLNKYIVPLKSVKPKYDSFDMRFDCFDITDIDKALSALDIDRTVPAVTSVHPGTSEAKKMLQHFIKNKLAHYAEFKNDPSKDFTSHMSAYLHFGQISPLYIALQVLKSAGPGKDAYLEELIVRRELSHNFVFYNNKYDTFDSLPPWARTTLNFHSRDKRSYLYSLKELENAKTHDKYWNAAQQEMLTTGKMHGYMRMYWGKKILEWSKNPRHAFNIAIYLNNKYQLDGRDPNGYAGIAWCFGKHDRPWPQRKIFGKVRYMNQAGLKRKFNIDSYAAANQILSPSSS